MEKSANLKRRFTKQLYLTSRSWRKAIDLSLVEHGISEACAAPLLWLSRLGGGIRQNALAEHIGIESPSLVRLLDQLEAMNMVVRRDDPTDRRAKAVWLTDEGCAMASRLEAVLDRERHNALFDISTEELETAMRVLTRLQEHCSKVAGGPDKKE